MPGLNRATLIGNLGKAPTIRDSSQGRVATLSLATAERWTDRVTGERHEIVEWHTIVVFAARLVDFLDQYARKGTRLYVEGRLQTRTWQDGDKVQRLATEIIINKSRGDIQLLSGGRKPSDPDQSPAGA